MLSDIEIAQQAKLEPIQQIAAKIGLTEDDLEPYGKYKAKVSLDVFKRVADRPNGKLIYTTAITATPAGEGKTCTTIGLTQALGRLGKKVMACLREPSLGPTMGIKGGAAGGGYAQVCPWRTLTCTLLGTSTCGYYRPQPPRCSPGQPHRSGQCSQHRPEANCVSPRHGYE